MKYECMPCSQAQTLDEFWNDHRHPCFLYNDRAFVCFGRRGVTDYGPYYLAKELGQDDPVILLGSTLVMPADLSPLEEERC
jgi:hypothetical protein